MVFVNPFSLPQACKPSQADWLNDLSSTPPVSVTIARLSNPSLHLYYLI